MTRDRKDTVPATKWISNDRLEEILEAYGAAPDRWPEDERGAALALIARSDDARAMRDAAARLDARSTRSTHRRRPIYWPRGSSA